jgi:predicted flap endonuclease-1-like 5' DNA nuclease
MDTTTALLVGALLGALVVLLIAWFVWGRKVGALKSALDASQGQVNTLQTGKASLESELNGLKASYSQMEEQKNFLVGEKTRLEGEKAQAEAVALKSQSEKSFLEGTVSRLQIEKSTLASEADRGKYENQKLRERLSEIESALQDDLTQVEGVSAALAYRLNRAGVRTFGQLGNLPPQRLVEIAREAGQNGSPLDEIKIVESARAAAGFKVDDLELIVGIGPVIARTLNNACIFSFADLACLTPEQLRSILGDKIQRLSDEASLIEQAKKLAAE